ncbi:MAG: universal stress protein [Pseudomonadota bacterium]|nr:universal stress protein [Pseudomonadota bacterium]
MNTSLAQLLVHLDASPQAMQRLEVACRLAQAHGAAVTALYAVTPSFVDLPFSPEIGPDIAASLRQIDEAQQARVLTAFNQSRLACDAHARWAEVGDAPVAAAFARQALYADLLVLGQQDPSLSSSTGVPADFVETVMATSGKPALILPYIEAPAQDSPQTVVIAWKPVREAARAVSAAMPLLQRARSVQILSWGSEEESVSGDRLDLNSYLRLHGVEATWHREAEEPEVLGELLLSRAFDLDADLLVMGCYGHSRAREWILGGTSRTVLQSMTLPVLMAH